MNQNLIEIAEKMNRVSDRLLKVVPALVDGMKEEDLRVRVLLMMAIEEIQDLVVQVIEEGTK